MSKHNARARYNSLASERAQFLDIALECADLTLPYLMKQESDTATHNATVSYTHLTLPTKA